MGLEGNESADLLAKSTDPYFYKIFLNCFHGDMYSEFKQSLKKESEEFLINLSSQKGSGYFSKVNNTFKFKP